MPDPHANHYNPPPYPDAETPSIMFFNPIIGILFNAKENRWHPIVFAESPLPGPDEPGKPVRHKSKMHHTGGFATREEAVANASGDLKSRVEGAKLAIDEDIEWDGEGVPALTAFFAADRPN